MQKPRVHEEDYAAEEEEVRGKVHAGCPFPNSPRQFGSGFGTRVTRVIAGRRPGFFPACLAAPAVPGAGRSRLSLQEAGPIFGRLARLFMTTPGRERRGSSEARSGFASKIEDAPFKVSSGGAGVFPQGPRGGELGWSDSAGACPLLPEDIALCCRWGRLRPYWGHSSSLFGLQAFRSYILFDCMARNGVASF
jgi:hypothetical protein